MSGRRFAPGGREYEKRKSQNKRRGPSRVQKEENDKDREEDTSEEEEEGKEQEEGSSEESEETGSESEGSEEEGGEGWKPKKDKQPKAKGLEGVIEVENPNRVKKEHIKASDISKLSLDSNPRKEREAAARAAAQNRQERNDLERLAQVRKQREEAARKREEEKKALESKKTKK